MYKKSITRIENENESSQADLSSPAMHDIIATNHVVLAKKSRGIRLSRACKALIVMIILALVAIGIIILTLVLAHSRNALMAIIARSAEENALSSTNNSRFLSINHENFTTMNNEQTTETSPTRSTIILTSTNLPRFTTPHLHISSSSIMNTEQFSEHSSLSTSSSNTIFDDESTTTMPTTVFNLDTTFLTSTNQQQMTTTTLAIATTNEEKILTSSGDHPTLSAIDDSTTLIQEEMMTSMPEETSFTAYFTRHFNIQSSSMTNHHRHRKIERKFLGPIIEEDVLDDVLFS